MALENDLVVVMNQGKIEPGRHGARGLNKPGVGHSLARFIGGPNVLQEAASPGARRRGLRRHPCRPHGACRRAQRRRSASSMRAWRAPVSNLARPCKSVST